MLTVNNFSLSYPSKKLFENFNAKFEIGAVYGIFGLNAIGKTSFFRAMYGLTNYTGEILLDDKPISKNDICFLETNNFFYPKLTGKEYLDVFDIPQKQKLFNTEELAELLGLPLNQNIDTYSNGMQKKISFLAILKLNRKVYLFDEPFNGVDAVSSQILISIIKKLSASNKLVFVTSHIPEYFMEVSNRFLILEKDCNYIHCSKAEFISYSNTINQHIDSRVNDTVL